MSQAKDGDTVKVHYTGKLDNGHIFDTSLEREPLTVEMGDGSVIPGFENGIRGMAPGDKKTITIAPEEAYGEIRTDLVLKVNKTEFPENISPEMGQQLQLTQSDGGVVVVTVTEIEEEQVTLDANHPLAGKTLIFDIELVELA